ncbi:hypothetical protein, partial [Cronobacter dublinensis]|uniref:hypothetical protein n=1 Tax=Cronobacter dublinensis TaxID=413497 RepID=UPI001F2AC57A
FLRRFSGRTLSPSLRFLTITISYKKMIKTTRYMGFVQVISGAFCGLMAFIGNANKSVHQHTI